MNEKKVITEAWRNYWEPPDDQPIYEWARKNIVLPPSFSMPGRFDVDKSRPLRAVFDCIQDDFTRHVSFRKPVRFGGTLIADVSIPWICCQRPGPVLWVWQSDKDAKDHMREKAWPAWNSCRQFRRMTAPLDRHHVTTTDVYFGPFFVSVVGANLSSLQSKGIRYLFCDETWMPVWSDMYAHALGRTRDYERVGNSKIIDTSQAGIAGDVESRNYDAGNQCVWGYKADGGKIEPLLFGGEREDGSRWGIVFADDAKRPDGTYNVSRACETVRYVEKCSGKEWPDHPSTIARWNRDGEWVEQNPTAPRHLRSFAVNALLNRSMASIIEEKLNAMDYARKGDIAPMKAHRQKTEALPWEEERKTVTLNVSKGGYTYNEAWMGKRFDGEVDRFVTIDRQQGMAGDVPHWWVEARAWRANGDSWQLYAGRVETIEAVRDIQLRFGVEDRKTYQDAGYDAPAVYRDCARFGWIAFFGSDELSWAHKTPRGTIKLPYSQPQYTRASNGQAIIYFHFSTDYCKDILARCISGQGAKWVLPDDVTEDYVAHCQAERKEEVKPGVFKWRKPYSTKPNHLWDCSVMQIVPALINRRLGLPEKSEGQDQSANHLPLSAQPN